MLYAMQTFAQTEDLAVFLGGNFQKIETHKNLGADLTVRYYFTDKLSFGGQLLYASKNYREDRLSLESFRFNVVTQYDVFQRDNMYAGFFLNNGVKYSALRNLDDVYLEENNDEYGMPYFVETARLLNKDFFYILTPGAEASVRIATISKEDNAGVYITLKAGYEFGFGRDHALRLSNPHGFIGSVGITFKGSTKSEETY